MLTLTGVILNSRKNVPWTNGVQDNWALRQIGPGPIDPEQLVFRQMDRGQMCQQGQIRPGQ